MTARYVAALTLAAAISTAQWAQATAGEKHQAKISIIDARHTALARMPGKVLAEELEHENHRWIYSFEIRPIGEKGKMISEVNIDADTGVVVDVHSENE
ncbi:MAG: PepSY domain-containing protein [Polyangiaceae bacterium]